MLEHLIRQHDVMGVLLAVIICALTSYTGITLAERASRARGRLWATWCILAAIAVGFGIWSTHFIAMLSYDFGFLVSYEPVRTVGSLLIAVIFTGVGICMSSLGRPLLGGLTVGTGIGAMHYIGMSALVVGGQIGWDAATVSISVVLGAAIAAAAFVLGARASRIAPRIMAAGLLALAICSLHFTAMGALDLSGCFSVVLPDDGTTWSLGLAVAFISLVALAVALVARSIEARDERRDLQEGARLTGLADAAFEGVLISVAGRVATCNQSFRKLTEFKEGVALTAVVPKDVLEQLRASPGELIRAEVWHSSGASIPVEAALRTITLREGRAEVVALRDLRQRLAAEREKEEAMRRITDSERRLRLLIQSVTDYAIYMLDTEGNVANWNVGAQRSKGYTEAEIVGQNYAKFFSAEDRKAGVPMHALAQARRHGKFEWEGWRYRKDGSRFWASVLLEPVYNEEGEHLGFAKITHDDTRQRQDAEKIAEIQDNLQLALRNMTQGLALFDAEGRLVLANEQLSQILDLPSDFATRSAVTLDAFIRLFGSKSNRGALSANEFHAQQRTLWQKRRAFELVKEMTDGRTVRVMQRPVPGGGWVATFEDITERRRSEEQISYMARHDTLTDLPNRASFTQHITWALDDVEGRDDRRLAVLGIDLDRFKDINDHHGHSVGDAVLQVVAKRLKDVLLPNEYIARIGGDEFAACTVFRHESELHAFVERLQSSITARLVVDDNDVAVGASIGIAVWPQDGQTADKLVNNADMAMYRAKAALVESVCYYQADMDELARERRLMATDLRQALARDELHLHYQIQKSVRTGETTGYEVLLRWHHPQRGHVSPVDFIPVAEECGAILPIGNWVLREACREASTWENDTRIAVNLSPVQLAHPRLVDMIKETLEETGFAAHRLELEVTESAIISDKSRALHTLTRIKALGVTVAIDDFGTGYSSLETLRSFPFDKIKLDRSFLHDVENSRQSRAVIRAILALGRGLEVPVLVEGVETAAQLSLLENEQCDEAQGFHLGRPQPAELIIGLRGTGKVA